jgi:TolA-binding protein
MLAAASAACGGSSRVSTVSDAPSPAEYARLFAADSARALSTEDGLFAAAIAFGTPGVPVYDAARAHGYLERFAVQFPASPRIREVQRMALLLDEIARLEQLEKELRRVAVRLDSINTRRNQQSQTVQQLQAELRRRDVQVKALEQELESLKAIDLRLRQRRPAIPPQ